tara:strand:+ start:2408 stop:2827 length:420 start_codon:yes stop_codon:yes gene_type:complete
MKFNNNTIILIIIILLILYLLDNIKEMEDNILKNDSSNNKYLHPRRKYFQDIYLNNPLRDKKISKCKDTSKNIQQVLPAVLSSHTPSIGFISQEKEIVIPSQDKFISGVSAPGSTTMVIGTSDNKETPVYIHNLDKRFN